MRASVLTTRQARHDWYWIVGQIDSVLLFILTIDSFYYIVWGIWLRHCLNGKQDEYELVWPRLVTSLPKIVKRQPSQAGALKKEL